ncbi:MAG: alpha/beta hydrolase [Acidimicrobiia bacterium]|nr:MAG: alpha/beta hydrolase [Acidimicrobiia bacterium]
MGCRLSALGGGLRRMEIMMSNLVSTGRLDLFVRRAGEEGGPPLVLVHGNVSSGEFFDSLIAELSEVRWCLTPDMRGYGGSERKPIDAARGLRDFSDDLFALLATLGVDGPIDLLGWSVGSGVVLQFLLDHPDRVRSLVLEAPMSPFGFGGTKGLDGEPVWPDFAGSGGGTANPEFVRRLANGDRSDESPVSPRNVLRTFYVKPPFEFHPDAEERYLTAMLQTRVGEDVYPGDVAPSENWPGVAPGSRGMNNAISPRFCDLSGIARLDRRPPILWIRGADDQIVSDTSLFDFGYLGQIGAVPDWPGAEVYPPQPMISQMRAVLDEYGEYQEELYPDCGHSPHLEHPERFTSDVVSFLEGVK